MFHVADTIRVDSDEDGFHLIVQTEAGEWHDFKIQALAWEFYEDVKRTIGEWYAEGKRAEAEWRYSQPVVLSDPAHWPSDEELAQPYDQDDPKHPDYHSIHADIWGSRAGK